MDINKSVSTIAALEHKRITPLGDSLRKWKLNEFPQMWNVLKGDMSFVGPRPEVPGYADKLEGEERLILKLRPGITGPATLKYANEDAILANVDNPAWYHVHVIYPDKVKLNLAYYYHHTLWGDIKYILKTVFHRK